MSTAQIDYMRLGDLQPAEVNPKLHDLPALVASLHRYGWTEPCLLDERTASLIAGHGRREALIWIREHGEAMPTGVFVDEDGEWLIPVRRGWSSRDDAEAKAYLIASNQLTISGGWHMTSLAQLLEEVVTDDAPLIETLGMTSDDIDDILRRGYETTGAGTKDVTEGDPWNDAPERRDPERSNDDDPYDDPTDKTVALRTCPACGHQMRDDR